MPKLGTAQHRATCDVVEAIPTQDLKWSLFAVPRMVPSDPKQGPFEPLNAAQPHDLLVGATSPPGWENTWLGSVPLIGPYLNAIYVCLVIYSTKYEAMADFLAEDLEKENSEWIGKRVGMKERSRKDV
jgi:hypothetical protein